MGRISPVGAYCAGLIFGLPVIVVALKIFNWAIPALAALLGGR